MTVIRPTYEELLAETEQLRLDLDRYRSLFQQLPIGAYIYHLEDLDDDRTLRMIDVNPIVQNLTGVPVDQVVGKTLDENFPGLREQGLPQAYAEVVRSGNGFSTESVYGDGRIVESAFAVWALPLPGNCMAAMFDNITQRKQAEADVRRLNAELEQQVAERTVELRRNQAWLESILANTPAAIYIKDLAGRFLLVNPPAAALMGHTPEELVDRRDTEFFPEEYVAAWRAAEQQVLETRQAYVTEESAPQADGLHTFLSSRVPIVNEKGEIYAIGGISTDVTHIKRAEEELRQSERRLQQIIDSLPSAVFWKDADLVYQGGNRVFAELAGVAKTSAIVGKTDFDLPWARKEAEGYRADDRAVMAANQPRLHIIETQQRADGQVAWLDTNKIPLHDDHGNVVGLLGTYEDITERKEMEHRLQASIAERESLQNQMIAAQQSALRELSTPLIPLTERVMIMPLIGTIDSARAQQVMEALLEGVANHHAEMVILDITGVQVVDTQVANAFIRAAQAVRLLGAQVMLTGIQPQIAETLVQLGVDLSGIMTRGSLQSGIAHAFELYGSL